MTPEQFCYWLQGFAELTKGCPPDSVQWASIAEHLQTVFKKITQPVVGPAIAHLPGQVSPQVGLKDAFGEEYRDAIRRCQEQQDPTKGGFKRPPDIIC